MRLTVLVVFIVAIIGCAYGQYEQYLSGFSPLYRPRFLSALRDPRSNTGPVLFPQNPESPNAETSGVVVGASGYGFVPPNQGFFAYFY